MAEPPFHHLVPDFILNHYAAGDFRGAFPAAGLFVDISGFASMTDRLMGYGQHGAEVLAEIMRSVTVFRVALAAWELTAERNPRIEAVAGLAKTSILLNRQAEARRAVEAVIDHLGQDITARDWDVSESRLVPLQGMDFPFQVLLETYEVLQNLRDPNAGIFLNHAHQLLQLAAERIGDNAMRQTFLENIPFHKKLAESYFEVHF